MKERPIVWLLMSERAGDNTQLRALADGLGFPYEVKVLAYRKHEWLPRIMLGATLLTLDRAKSASLVPPFPDLILLASRKAEAVAFWIRKNLNPKAKIIFLGTPWAGLDSFDLVITTPQYRLPQRPNVLHNDLPLHDVWPERLAKAAEQWLPRLQHLPRPWTAVLAGGRSGPYLFGVEAAKRLARQASDRASPTGGSLLVTTSSRTTAAASEALKSGLTAPHFFFQWRKGQTENPFHAFLALAGEIIVTADSVSMISEAVATGKPTYLFDIEEGPRAMRAEEGRSIGGRPAAPHWKGADFPSTLWRIGLGWGPDWWTRDIRIVHRNIVQAGRASWLGDEHLKSPQGSTNLDLDRALTRVKALLAPDF